MHATFEGISMQFGAISALAGIPQVWSTLLVGDAWNGGHHCGAVHAHQRCAVIYRLGSVPIRPSLQ